MEAARRLKITPERKVFYHSSTFSGEVCERILALSNFKCGRVDCLIIPSSNEGTVAAAPSIIGILCVLTVS